MANPFDKLVTGDGEQETPTPQQVKKKKQSQGGDEVRISLTFSKHVVERLIYILIIIILGGMVLFDPFGECGALGSATDKVDTKVAEKEVLAEVEEVVEEPEVEEPVEEPEPKEEPADEPEDDTPKPFKGNFDFTITDVDFEYSEDDPDRASKIISITYIMKNRWQDLKPDLKIYWYDLSAGPIIQNKIRGELSLPTIKKGQTQKLTLQQHQFTSKFFHPGRDDEIIEIHLFDRETKEELMVADYKLP